MNRRHAAALAAFVTLVPLSACSGSPSSDRPTPGPATSLPPPATESSGSPSPAPTRAAAGTVSVFVQGLATPWGLAFLPTGEALVAERDDRRIMRVARDGRVTEAQRLPEVSPQGEGGLLGIALSPRYATDGLVYAYYTTANDNRIVRFRLGGQPQPILTGLSKAAIHNGGRIAFGPDGMLYAGVGDAGQRDRAQDRTYLGGKILRMTPDGQPAPGNPFPDSLVYSLGHRNVQGLAWDSAGRLYASEFGQNTWDEINLIQPGRNYGWPTVEGRGNDDRFVNPLVTWSTDEASPSGIAILGDQLYAAALRGQRLWRVPLDGNGGVGAPVALLAGRYGRLRTVAAAPDGTLWITTSNRDRRGSPADTDDRILRLTP